MKNKILLTTNNPENAKIITASLQQRGYEVINAVSGREAFRLARREHPDLIISRMELTDIPGLEFCRMIRADKQLRATPFIFLSEFSQSIDKIVEALHAGADDFLTEFTNVQELNAKVVWFIEQKKTGENLRQYYQILRHRQSHITKIIKGTLDLFSNLNADFRVAPMLDRQTRNADGNIGRRIELGMNMIDGLANLLEEQVAAIEMLGGTVRGEDIPIDEQFIPEKNEMNYHGILVM
ncbi:MAG: response regulator [Pyrinomonadaceae bacterium]|nr:response regulator [Pyrinomonadaceae bacterium]